MEPRRAPCWKFLSSGREIRGSIDWGEFLEVWDAYFAKNQARPQKFQFLGPKRLAQNGGFSYAAATKLLGHPPTTWRAEPVPE